MGFFLVGCGLMLVFSAGASALLPLFTNQLAVGRLAPTAAAVNAIHLLAITKVICVAVSVLVVQLLPKVKRDR